MLRSLPPKLTVCSAAFDFEFTAEAVTVFDGWDLLPVVDNCN